MRRTFPKSLAAFSAGVCLLAGAAGAGESFRLNTQNSVVVKILEWLPAKGEYKEWEALGGEYAIRDDGSLSIPFVGAIDAAGLQSDELAAKIGAQIKDRLGLSAPLEVSVEVAKFGSVFVLGGVQTPGKVNYSPHLTVMQAVALAGGFYRGDGSGFLRLERDAIGADSDLRKARLAAARDVAKLTRLRAEIDGAAELVVDPAYAELLSVPDPVLDEERAIMNARRKSLDSRLASIEGLIALVRDRIAALEQKRVNLDKQLAITIGERDNVTGLVKRGLALAARSLELERTVADIEGRRLDIETALLEAGQQLNEAERDAIDIRTEFQSQVVGEMQATRDQLDQNLVSLEAGSQLLREATVTTPGIVARTRSAAGEAQISYVVLRQTGVGPVEVPVEPGDEMEPGDVLQVNASDADGPSDLVADARPSTEPPPDPSNPSSTSAAPAKRAMLPRTRTSQPVAASEATAAPVEAEVPSIETEATESADAPDAEEPLNGSAAPLGNLASASNLAGAASAAALVGEGAFRNRGAPLSAEASAAALEAPRQLPAPRPASNSPRQP